MIKIKEKINCSGCHACVLACPKSCIKMIRDEEGFLYPSVDEASCIQCGKCEKVCPIINPLLPNKEESTAKAYAAYTKNEEVRLQSSSGGIFTEIATYIIQKGGVVFGAAFNDVFAVEHIFVDKTDDLWRLRGSKYLQSTIGNAYKEAKQFLKEGRMVLFTGTPCQIGGLYSYLGKKYDNLITQDIICHGVPSPLVWEKYVQYREKLAASKTRRTFFRQKKYGWKTYSVRFEFSNRTEYEQIFSKDLFMRAFLADLCLRPSCYSCAFKGMERVSDFTVADFWGIEQQYPEMDDNKGTSLLFVNSKKAERIFHCIQPALELLPVVVESAIESNPAMIQSATMPSNREKFMEQITKSKLSFQKIVNKNCPSSSLVRRVFRKLGRAIRL